MTDIGLVKDLVSIFAPLLVQQGAASIARFKNSRQKQLDHALDAALFEFREQYADVETSLFDKHFIRQGARPLFSRYFSGSQWPSAEEVADAWTKEVGPSAHGVDVDRVRQAARAFLDLLENELRIQKEFHYLFTNRIVADVGAIRKQLTSSGLPLWTVRNLRATMFELGDERAATFPYCSEPLQGTWDTVKTVLQRAAKGGDTCGVLLFGAANSGKTRLIYEVLHATVPDWNALLWRPDYGADLIPHAEALHQRDIIVFLDDLQPYSAPVFLKRDNDLTVSLTTSNPAAITLATLIQRVRSEARHTVLVATCRTEAAENVRAYLPTLFQELVTITVPSFSADFSSEEAHLILADFAALGATHLSEWDGTIGSVVLGLGDKEGQYLAQREQLPGAILRSMKLLSRAMTTVHTEVRLRAISTEVFGFQDIGTRLTIWHDAVRTLLDQQFITEVTSPETGEIEFRIRKDSYFDRVITDYPRRESELGDHLTALRATLFQLQDTNALSNLGVAISSRLGHAAALEIYEDALLLDPGAVPALENKANSLYFLDKLDQALQVSDQLLAKDALSANGWSNRGVILAGLQRNEEALAAFDRALKLDARSAITTINKGTLLSGMKRNIEALACYEQALPMEPDNVTLLLNLGVVRHRLRKFQAAREVLEHTLKLDPMSTIAKVNLAAALSQLKEAEQALTLLDSIADSDPVAWQAWHNRGTTLAKLDRNEAALEAYDHALTLNSQQALSLACKAGVLNKLSRFPEAIALCEQARKIDVECVDAWRNLGGALCAAKFPELGIEALNIALYLDSSDASSWYFKGVALFNQGNNSDALEALERALELEPTLAAADQARKEVLRRLQSDPGNERST